MDLDYLTVNKTLKGGRVPVRITVTQRDCKNCDSPFVPTHASQKYCCVQCQKSFGHSRPQEIRCAFCLKRFLPKTVRGEFCNDKCRVYAARKTSQASQREESLTRNRDKHLEFDARESGSDNDSYILHLPVEAFVQERLDKMLDKHLRIKI